MSFYVDDDDLLLLGRSIGSNRNIYGALQWVRYVSCVHKQKKLEDGASLAVHIIYLAKQQVSIKQDRDVPT